MKIMFVCLGNICRSPLAHAILENLIKKSNLSGKISVESSGTAAYHVGHEADDRMIATAANHNIYISHKARQIKQADLNDYDMIIAMDKKNYKDIKNLTNNKKLQEKIYLFREFDDLANGDLDTPDPYFGGIDGFEDVFEIVNRTCKNILKNIASSIL